MNTTVIARRDTQKIVAHLGLNRIMDEMISRLESAFKAFDPNETLVPARSGFQYKEPGLGLLEWMPSLHLGKKATIKVVGYHPSNPDLRNLPTVLSTVSIYDVATGHLIGMADATFLTALRTGAASAVASRILSRPDSRVLGLIGCGANAVTQMHALSRVRDFERVLVCDISAAARDSFSRRGDFIGLDIEVVEDLEKIIETADVLCTSTTIGVGEGPLFADCQTKPWLHINAVGSDFPGKIELPLSVLRRSLVCPDFLEQARAEGECQQLAPEEIGPELYELVQQQDRNGPLWDQRTVFDSTGWALEDQVAMEMLIELAQELGLGTELAIEAISPEPRDPYLFARQSAPELVANGVEKR